MTVNAPGAQTHLTEQVAEEIRALLARRRMSGRELARRLETSPSWVNFRLTGAQEIGLNDLQRIAAVLDVEVADLLPRASEGRVLPTGARHSDGKGTGITIRKFGLTNRPGLFGHPKRTQPDPSTRRPARVLAACPAT